MEKRYQKKDETKEQLPSLPIWNKEKSLITLTQSHKTKTIPANFPHYPNALSA